MSDIVYVPPTPGAVKSVFPHLDCLVEAIDQLKQAGYTNFVVTSPLPRQSWLRRLRVGRCPLPPVIGTDGLPPRLTVSSLVGCLL